MFAIKFKTSVVYRTFKEGKVLEALQNGEAS